MTPENRALALKHAMTEIPREACGVLIIERGHEVFVPCRNLSPFRDAFMICPEDYANAEDRGEVVRIIHSHPYSRATPSEVDRVSCEASGVPWSIVSVPNGDWHDFNPTGYRAPLVGREWAHGLLDCYSLIRDHYREAMSIELPDFERDYEWWFKGQDLYIENFAKAGFREVPIESLQVNDVLLMQVMSPVVNHGAVYLGNDQMLHHLHRRLSCRDVFGGYWRKHTVKVVRHENCSIVR